MDAYEQAKHTARAPLPAHPFAPEIPAQLDLFA